MKSIGLFGVAVVAASRRTAGVVYAGGTNETAVLETAEAAGLLCPAVAACHLELGTAFGNPWIKASSGEAGYFELDATPAVQPSEVVVTLAYGDVETYARSGGKEPTAEEFEWRGGRVLRLSGWSVPHEGDKVVVMVNATSEARYRVLAASDQDVLQLEDGMPVPMLQEESQMRYFSIALADNASDLTISLDAQSGDPDMYVSLLHPQRHYLPTSDNFTWQALSFGTDTLVVQSEELNEHCIPGTEGHEVCAYAIGVATRSNSSYTIKASLNSGWKNPQQLLLGQPQSSYLEEGNFDYYALLITQAPEEDPWESVVVTLTPTDGGMQDLYATTNRTREPGPKDYDVKSSSWAGSSVLVFSETAPGFCTGCTIFVGVRGFKKGGYSIVASQGLTRLQEGLPQQGVIPGGEDGRYYEFFNPPGHRQPIQVVATALTGDPDLYVAVGGSDLPGPHNFNWIGGDTGNDFVDILPDDEEFCEDCSYQIGLRSAGPSSFTVSVSRGDESTLLVHGRPQAGKVAAGGIRYYTVRPDLDTVKMTVTLTESVGSGDIYVAKGNGTTAAGMIDPQDPQTFSWTSKRLSLDRIVVDVDGGDESNPYLIGVVGETDCTFSVMATFSQGLALLQAGVPQQHSIQGGQWMTFGFLVDQGDEDLRLTVTPMTGDPALYAGMWPTPTCTSLGQDGEGGRGGDADKEVICTGWTWSSTTGRRREIPISPTHPCNVTSPQVPHSNPETNSDPSQAGSGDGGEESGSVFPPPLVNVSAGCVQSSFGVGMMFMTVVAQGGRGTRFSIVASTVGERVVLVTGVPQHAATSPMVLCGEVTQSANAPCSGQHEASSVMQEVMFVFRVEAGSTLAKAGFALTLQPDCETPGSYGCPDKPASVYINSCLEGSCTLEDKFPRQGNADKELKVSSAHGMVFIAETPGSSSGGGDGVFCVPPGRGKGTCVFYVAVTGGVGSEPVMKLTAMADVLHGISLVTPCIGDDGLADGMIVTAPNGVPEGSTGKTYELCSEGDVNFQVSVESCWGKPELFVGSSPRAEDGEFEYRYVSNGVLTCKNLPPPAGQGREQCDEPHPGDPPRGEEVSVVVRASDFGGAGGPEEEKGEETGRRFFAVVGILPGQKAIFQENVLRVNLLGEGEVPTSPVLSAKALPDVSGGGEGVEGVPSLATVGRGEASVKWGGAVVTSPAVSGGDHEKEAQERDCGDYCSYEVFAVPTRIRENYQVTPCGLESVRRRYQVDVVYRYVGTPNGRAVPETSVVGLRDEEYDVYVMATCDSLCLGALVPTQCRQWDRSFIRPSSAPCNSQRVVLTATPATLETFNLYPTTGASGSGGGGDDGDDSGSYSPRSRRSPIPLLAAVLLVTVAGIAYALHRQGGGGGVDLAGGARATHLRGGFELTDLQGRRDRNAVVGDGLGDFLVGERSRGSKGGNAEAGPAYTSLLSGGGAEEDA